MKKETERLAKEFFTCVQIDATPSTNDIEKAANHMLALQSRLESLEKDAARWEVFVKISRNMMMPRDHREHSYECSLYFDTLSSGHEAASAIDAVLDAMEGKHG